MKINYLNFIEKTCYILIGSLLAILVLYSLFGDLLKYQPVENSLNQLKDSQYDNIHYNCVDFSHEAQVNLKNNNINAQTIVIQKPSEADTHAIISIWLDPQTGQFVSDGTYVGQYSELKTKYGWAK